MINITKKQLFIVLVCIVSLVIIIYKFNKTETDIEAFENKLEKLKNSNKNKNKSGKRNNKLNKKKNSNSNKDGGGDSSDGEGRKKATFNDLMKETESMNIEKYSYDNIKQDVLDYYKSFNKEKFKNDSKDTAEALDKFSLYKKKFFEIFDD